MLARWKTLNTQNNSLTIDLSEDEDLDDLPRDYWTDSRVYPKVFGLSQNEIYTYNNKHSLRNNIKGHGGKTH
jgi:hypothetical protein